MTLDVLGALVAALFVIVAWICRVLWRITDRVSRLEGGRDERGRR